MERAHVRGGPAKAVLHVLGWSSYECFLGEAMAAEIRRFAASANDLGLLDAEIASDVDANWPGRFRSVEVTTSQTRSGRLVELVCVAAASVGAGVAVPVAA